MSLSERSRKAKHPKRQDSEDNSPNWILQDADEATCFVYAAWCPSRNRAIGRREPAPRRDRGSIEHSRPCRFGFRHGMICVACA